MTAAPHQPEAESDEGPRWRRRPEERPEEILSAALEVFGEIGFANATLDAVARKAGVCKGTLYLYFDSKDALFREMLRSKCGAALALAEERLDGFRGTAGEALEFFIRCMWDEVRRPEMVRIARLVHAELGRFPELARFHFSEVIVRSRRLVARILDRGVAEGEFRPTAHGFAVRAIPAFLVQGAMSQRGFGQYDPDAITDDQLVEGVIDLVRHGVLARPAAPAGGKE
ncbi:MAG TPA: TetR/AcrR family transcriptional regulator [Gemmatimonadales bacterium]|jgi:AcrR family transcriptional regulator|nr:TetR/AcrR family transcriptional regulator [Gemmatimonadales bacterium]